MTDQTSFERELTDRLRARADRTRVDLDHDRIVGTSPRRARPPAARPTWAVAGAFAGVIALVVAGLVLLVRTGEDDPAPADTFPPAVTVPATLPATVPSSQDFGILDDTDGPTLEDHWHVAYGFHLCGQWFQLSGNLESPGSSGYDMLMETGIHSHDDGVIHIHPYTDRGAGDNARLGVFLGNYDVVLADAELALPAEQPMTSQLQCEISTTPISVVVWPDALNPVDPIVVTTDLFDVPLRDGAAITITDTLDGVTPPPWASALPALGAVDMDQTRPGDLLEPGVPPVVVP